MDEGQVTQEDFVTADEKEAKRQLAGLEGVAHRGAMFSDWARSWCSVELFKWLDEQILDSRNAWLACANREEAEAVRIRAQGYTKIKSWIMAQKQAGDLAGKAIKTFHDEGIQLEGLIRQPPTAQ